MCIRVHAHVLQCRQNVVREIHKLIFFSQKKKNNCKILHNPDSDNL